MKSSRENVVQAMVSVIAVKIQFNSPSGVRRSLRSPGTCMTMSAVISLGNWWFMMKNLRAMSMGDVRQEVKISAGSSGDEGRCSLAAQAAS